MQVFNHGFDFMFFRLSKSRSGLINLLQLFMAEEEKVKVERNLADLKKVGFPKNVYLFLDLNIFNIIRSVCELCSCFKSSIELVSIRWPPSIVRVLLDY